MGIKNSCLIFPFSKANSNSISALLASLDIDPILNELDVMLPNLKTMPINLISEIQKYDKIVLAFSVYTTQLEDVSSMIKQYRQIIQNQELLIFCGGPHAIGDPFSMLINGADIVCTGEGEITFPKIIKKYISNQDFLDTPGIAYFNKSNIFVKNPKENPINLNDFPPFSVKHNLIRPIEITRGCAWKCRFCQIRSRGGSKVRHRSISQILKYIDITIKHYSNRRPDIRFISPNALSYGSSNGKDLDLNYLEELLSSIKNMIGPSGKIYFGSFPSEVRPETITKESVEILKKYSNSSNIILGGQSGSNRLLEYSSRGHDVDETERATKLLIDAGFQVMIDIIFGLPDEKLEDIELTKNHILKLIDLGATIHSHTFLPLVGTPFANQPAGQIHPEYKKFISNLISQKKLKGQHNSQEIQAKIISSRRKKEQKIKRIHLDLI